jgi:hypothetical protein
MPVNAGVIEGFFGKSWDWQARIDGVEFLRDAGYRFYIYAPKSDPFLRRRWSDLMPPAVLEPLALLSAACRTAGLTFGAGLTPFEIYRDYNPRARESLRAKVRQLNDLGVELLCILFDDMRGEVLDLAALQADVIADICANSTASRFVVCPTYYSDDPVLARHFGTAPTGYLRELGRALDPAIDFFWTGEQVISDGYRAAHLTRVAEEIGRKPFIWDNASANDSRTRCGRLFLDPTAGAWELPVDLVAGLAINPMNQPHLSRIALCGYRQLLTGSLRGADSLRTACTGCAGLPLPRGCWRISRTCRSRGSPGSTPWRLSACVSATGATLRIHTPRRSRHGCAVSTPSIRRASRADGPLGCDGTRP